MPTVIFGPGREPVYTPNEWLETADIEQATRVYAATAAMLLAPDARTGSRASRRCGPSPSPAPG